MQKARPQKGQLENKTAEQLRGLPVMPDYEFARLIMGKTVSEYGQSNVTDKNATGSGRSRHQRVKLSVLKRVSNVNAIVQPFK